MRDCFPRGKNLFRKLKETKQFEITIGQGGRPGWPVASGQAEYDGPTFFPCSLGLWRGTRRPSGKLALAMRNTAPPSAFQWEEEGRANPYSETSWRPGLGWGLIPAPVSQLKSQTWPLSQACKEALLPLVLSLKNGPQQPYWSSLHVPPVPHPEPCPFLAPSTADPAQGKVTSSLVFVPNVPLLFLFHSFPPPPTAAFFP